MSTLDLLTTCTSLAADETHFLQSVYLDPGNMIVILVKDKVTLKVIR